ncbi:MAG: GMC oxidoreductase, partial [Polyangiaceae bacterium]
GVMQQSCTHVGECVIGCPRRAKNTLDLNYLAVAERLGAEMRTECEVTRIEPLASGEGYRVSYVDRRHGEAKETVEASYVFLCAGAVCSTTLLLQCRAAGALPRLSPKLGEGYSGNGDLLLLSFRSSRPWDPSNGPTITTGLVYSGKEPGSWFLLEDGGFSRHLWPLFELADPGLGWRRVPSGIELLKGQGLGSGATAVAPPTAADVRDVVRRVSEAQPPGQDTRTGDGPPPLASLPPGMGSTAMFLAMGRDLANGTIRLAANGTAMLAWDVPQNLLLYSLEERLARDLTGKLGGEFATSPFWRFAHLPGSVHNLGGCAMGESPDKGVTSQLGEVWGHQNLFVMDGAILPAATGVNPSHTIAAVAERNIEQIIRRITGNPAWAPPERREVTAYPDPLSRVAIPAEGTPPPETPGLGLTMREAMIGYFRTGKAESITDRVPRVAVCRLRITIGYLARFLSDPSHPGLVTGNVYLGGLTAGEAEVQEGVWNLFVAPGAGPEREMRYVLPFIGQDGRRYTLRGTKLFVPHPGLRLWRENTVLDFRVHEGVEEDGAVVGEGKVRIGLFGVVRLLLSFRVTGQDDPAEKARAVLGFAGFYLRELLLVSWPSSALTRLFKVGF